MANLKRFLATSILVLFIAGEFLKIPPLLKKEKKPDDEGDECDDDFVVRYSLLRGDGKCPEKKCVPDVCIDPVLHGELLLRLQRLRLFLWLRTGGIQACRPSGQVSTT